MSDLNRASPHEPYPRLFAPFELAGKRLKNRIVHAAITLRWSAGGGTPQRLFDYHSVRARGGAAMIVTEPIGIAPHQGNQRIVASDDSMRDELARWAEAVESHDCRLIGQIQDTGRGRHVPGRTFDAIGPSALPDDLSWTVPHAMTRSDIAAFVDSTAASSLRMKRAGFSGVEISAGHGHLFHQFLSPRSNHREDDHGGDLAGRCRFVVELCQAIRSACGNDFILGVKLPGDDGVPDSIDAEAAACVAVHLTQQVPIDYLCYAQGSHHRTLEMHLPDGSYRRLPFIEMTRRLRRATPDTPVIALGRITDPAEAEALLQSGDFSLVGLGRPLVTDAAWPQKAARGGAADIRYCVSCNTCWKVINTQLPIACDNNPRLGRADELDVLPASPTRRRIAVVGAGIAGLEAAMTAAQRGHDVVVFGASAEVGGKARLHAAMPIAESISSIYDYQSVAAARAGVRFELGRPVDAGTLIELAPDVVVLATGATMSWPLCLPSSLRSEGVVQDLREAMASLGDITQAQAGAAVVFDMDHTDGTYAAIERLRDLFERVVVLTPRERLADDTSLVVRQRVQRRFHERGIDVLCLVEPRWTSRFELAGTLQYQSVFGGPLMDIDDVAFFSYATPRIPDVALAATLRTAGIDLRLVGDCRAARGALEATAEGHAVGLAI